MVMSTSKVSTRPDSTATPGDGPGDQTNVPDGVSGEGTPLVPDSEWGGNNRFGGWIPDLPDTRDDPLLPPLVAPSPGPQIEAEAGEAVAAQRAPRMPGDSYLGLRNRWLENVQVYDQAPYESCVSCAVASVINFLEVKDSLVPDIEPSRLFLYYNARALEGNENNPTVGTGIRTAIKGLNRFGACEDEAWPYQPESAAPPPNAEVYRNVFYKNSTEYTRIFRLDTRRNIHELNLAPVRRALTNDIPVICGFTAYRSFINAKFDGVVNLPTEADKRFGLADPAASEYPASGVMYRLATFGHAAVIIGYEGAGTAEDSVETGTYTLVNSWGKGWGNNGTFTLPAAYLADAVLASDFWAITSLSRTEPHTSAAAPRQAD